MLRPAMECCENGRFWIKKEFLEKKNKRTKKKEETNKPKPFGKFEKNMFHKNDGPGLKKLGFVAFHPKNPKHKAKHLT